MNVYVSIGNSDDKLTQKEWSRFCADLRAIVRAYQNETYGTWYSACDSEWQNMCIGFRVADSIADEELNSLRNELSLLSKLYNQDSIALSTATTELIGEEK